MKFIKLVSELMKLKLPKDQFTVITSGAMAARGIREANDFDIVTTKELWERLAQEYEIVSTDFRLKIIPSENIEILGPSHNPANDLFLNNELIRNSEEIDGVNFANLNDVSMMKEKLGREKDLKDIKLIKKYLANSSAKDS